MRILSIDQSYTRTGFAVIDSATKEMLVCESVTFQPKTPKTVRRHILKDRVRGYCKEYTPGLVVVERVRTFSKGFISTATIIALGSLITTVVDSVPTNTPVVSADTRAWKGKILGASSANKDDAVNFAYNQYGIRVDHDAADALCIGLYATLQSALLKREE